MMNWAQVTCVLLFLAAVGAAGAQTRPSIIPRETAERAVRAATVALSLNDASRALSTLEQLVGPQLQVRINDPSVQLRFLLALATSLTRAKGKTGSMSAVLLLVPTLKTRGADPMVRIRLAEALSRIGDSQAAAVALALIKPLPKKMRTLDEEGLLTFARLRFLRGDLVGMGEVLAICRQRYVGKEHCSEQSLSAEAGELTPSAQNDLRVALREILAKEAALSAEAASASASKRHICRVARLCPAEDDPLCGL